MNLMPQSPPHKWDNAIKLFRGTHQPPDGFERLQDYLAANGVVHFSAHEITKPNHPDKAAKCGYKSFLPPKHWWPKGLFLCLVADKCRALAGGPVKCRNWWRPLCYNRLVSKSGRKGDHPWACAFDLDFKTRRAKRKALKWLNALYATGLFEMSLGVYSKSLHVGFFSPSRQRRW